MTSLAQAVAVTGDARRRVIERFVRGAGPGTYTPTRSFMRRLYGSHGAEDGAVSPLIAELPPEPWDKIEADLIKACEPDAAAANVQVARLINKHAREEGYVATHFDVRVLRTGRSIVPVPIDLFVTKDERLIFQFPQLWRTSLKPSQEDVIATVIALVCATGDYATAEIEIVSFPPIAPPKRKPSGEKPTLVPRGTKLTTIDRRRFISRERLQAEIDDVYTMLKAIAAE